MKNATMSELFSEMADIMEILGEDRFRINGIADLKTAIENDKLIERLAFADYIESG